MDFDFDLDSKQLDSILKKLPKKVKGRVTRNAVAAGARVIRKEARALAPYNPKRTTGVHLRDGIVVKRENRDTDVHIIGTRSTGSKAVPHAHLQEFGTIKQAPKPFLRPAFRQKGAAAIERIAKNLSTGILRESKKLAGK